MLTQWLRTIKKTLTSVDVSLENQDDSEVVLFDTDFIYIGKLMTFNHLFFWIENPNDTDATLKVEIFDGTSWKTAVDILDATRGLKKSGVLQFMLDDDTSWTRKDSDDIVELDDAPKIFNLYWIRISVASGAVNPLTSLKRIGYALTTQQMIKALDPDLEQYLPAFGQIDFTSQILTASMETAIDLKAKGIIVDDGQIVQFDDFAHACAYKTLSIIYFSLGSDFNEKRVEANRLFSQNLRSRRLTVDQDGDGRVDLSEVKMKIRELVR